MIQPNDNVSITLTLQELTQVINWAAEIPYKFSAPVIQKLVEQLQAQQQFNGLDRAAPLADKEVADRTMG